MKQPVIAIYDRKTALFDTPIMVRHVGTAIREFETLKSKPETKYGLNPEDYQMFQVALYDDETGAFENVAPHVGLS